MSNKTFGQAVLLILIAGAVYFGIVQLLNWQNSRIYNARVNEIRADAESRMRALDSGSIVAPAPPATVTADPRDTNENIIDGQTVHRRGDDWVNDAGQVMGKAGD